MVGNQRAGIEQVGDRLLDGGQLQAFDGTVFVAGDDAFVFKGPVRRLGPATNGRGRGDADGAVGEPLAGEHLAAASVILVTLRAGMKAEADFFQRCRAR